MADLLCLKDDTFELIGDYNTDVGSQFIVAFERCNEERPPPGVTCQSKKRIDEWLARKFITTYYNLMEFSSQIIGEESTSVESYKRAHLEWTLLSPQMRQDYYRYI